MQKEYVFYSPEGLDFPLAEEIEVVAKACENKEYLVSNAPEAKAVIYAPEINYYLAKWVGRPIIYRFADSRIGHMCLIDRQKVEVAEEYFRKHGAASTIFGRLVPAVRQLISIPAGLAGMHVGKFLLYTTIGAGVWNTVLAAIGWGIYKYTDYKTTHDVYQQAVQYSHEIGYVILALAVVVVAFIAYKGIKKK